MAEYRDHRDRYTPDAGHFLMPPAGTGSPDSPTLSSELDRLRDVPGLSLLQRRWLAARLFTENDRAASAGLTADLTIASHWKQEADGVFLREYQRVIQATTADLFERFREEMAKGAQAAALTARDLLTAEDPITDKAGNVVGSRPAWNARSKGVESYQRAAGAWNPQPIITTDSVLAAALSEMAALQREAIARQTGQTEQVDADARAGAIAIEGTATTVDPDPDQPLPEG